MAHTDTPRKPGRPPGHARALLLAVVQAGISGTFDTLARHTGLPEQQVRQTLYNLRYAGLLDATRAPTNTHPQRCRAIYSLALPARHIDALAYAGRVWCRPVF